ncbi:hypothetical protein DPMN_042415 [Dreissena polymorpha]|uniref:Uncharacterized protein n=1 Tax=Dreissena polymorpha TaxID=45954 RepID=A0A9D4CZ20_DREPO|nr:hypothetical protein DPMN_042415 [Dreissena polymorpha]
MYHWATLSNRPDADRQRKPPKINPIRASRTATVPARYLSCIAESRAPLFMDQAICLIVTPRQNSSGNMDDIM